LAALGFLGLAILDFLGRGSGIRCIQTAVEKRSSAKFKVLLVYLL
jgi:hypothetical protein